MIRFKPLSTSAFVISLDFELMWGVFDKRTIDTYGNNIKGVHNLIPELLHLFRQYGIHCTWAAVGCLYYEELAELKQDMPTEKPKYINNQYSAYSHINTINPINFPTYYSGLHLIAQIKSTPGQEIGTHTFSHYYCLEEGQTIENFRADLKMAIEKAQQFGVKVQSIIFPRNQYSKPYLNICREEGILAYRGNENNFLQKPRGQKNLNLFIRSMRFADSYVNITGRNIYNKICIDENGLVNVPASFFFRPYRTNGKLLEYLKLQRYKKSMLAAAKSGGLFHLWWHPHNFGAEPSENLAQLKELLEYYKLLEQRFGMRSFNMEEIAHAVTSQ